MKKEVYNFSFDVYDSIDELQESDKKLLKEAQKVTEYAYAPYSHFRVGAAALLNNNEIVKGTNQENASFPVGLCAERVLLSATASLFPDVPVKTLAVSYYNEKGGNNHPISPCGICRQSLLEYQTKLKQAIRIILGGMHGKVYILERADMLLPLSFSADELNS